MSILTELKRRNVFRVAAAYLVTGWLAVQIIAALSPIFEISLGFQRGVILLLLIGFIPVMFFTWAYEITEEGIKKETEIERDASLTAHTAKKLNIITLLAVVGAGGMFVYQQMNPPHSDFPADDYRDVGGRVTQDAKTEVGIQNTESEKLDPSLRWEDDKGVRLNGENAVDLNNGGNTENAPVVTELNSIAVLAFENMSSDKEQEYFADGISEEILNALVKATGLRVAGRTSSFSFKGKDDTIKQIGEALNVAHVLEGSVRKQGNKVRITAQLIKADDEFHLWSETYDGNLDNIFDLQENISRQVTDELKIILDLNTDERLASKMTSDTDAYDFFLRGRQLVEKRFNDNIPKGIQLLQEAVKLDPKFAEAWATLAEAEMVSDGYYEVDKAESEKRAIAYAEKAITLNNQLALPHAVLGLFHSDYGNHLQSLDDLKDALRLEPNNVLVNRWIGNIYVKLNRIDLASSYIEKAYRLDPLSATNTFNQASLDYLRGNFDAAIKMMHESERFRDDLLIPISVVYEAQGKYEQAREYFTQVYKNDFKRGLSSMILPEDEMMVLNKGMFGGTLENKIEAQALSGMYLKNSDNQAYWQLPLVVMTGNIDRVYAILEEKPAFFHNFSADHIWYPNKAFKAFRGDPRFIKLLQKNNFPQTWQVIGWPETCQPNAGTDGSDGQFSCE